MEVGGRNGWMNVGEAVRGVLADGSARQAKLEIEARQRARSKERKRQESRRLSPWLKAARR